MRVKEPYVLSKNNLQTAVDRLFQATQHIDLEKTNLKTEQNCFFSAFSGKLWLPGTKLKNQ